MALEAIWRRHPDAEVAELMAEGIAQLQMGRHALQGALQTFERIVRRAPSFAEGWNKLATCQYLLKQCASVLSIDATRLLLYGMRFWLADAEWLPASTRAPQPALLA